MEEFWKKKTITAYILSVLVFCIHCSSFRQYTITSNAINVMSTMISGVIPSVAVPLFFIISGALFYRNYDNSKYLSKVKRRATSLIIPYLIWNTLSLVFNIFITKFLSGYITGREKVKFTPTGILGGCYTIGITNSFGLFLL